ncbi:MAG: peptidoglycan DD-metalloendopeptidase family protein [Gammaproteobacteria bacterium]
MKNRLYKSFFLGISSAVVATASYALIAPDNKVGSADLKAFTENTTLSPTLSIQDSLIEEIEENNKTASKSPATQSFRHKVQSGDTLSSIFSKFHLDRTDLYRIVKGEGKQFASITPGKTLEVTATISGKLIKLAYQINALETLTAKRENDTFNIDIVTKQADRAVERVSTTIHSSLFEDGKKAGLPDKSILQLAEIFGWDIDFAMDIKEGDSFTLLYEKLYFKGKQISTGSILAAQFINQGKTYRAVKYKNKQDRSNFYTPEGQSLRKAFIRTPVDFARISSHFDLKRKHPILNRIRAHKGVDYAAKSGTPVKCTGDGIIAFRGWQKGYGRVVVVQHGSRYSTLYAHLSEFNKHYQKGSRVDQGAVIGYVGQSGLATGPHLHYEFRVNGVHRNPLTVALPNSVPLDKSLMDNFKASTQPLLAQLEDQSETSLLAQNQP